MLTYRKMSLLGAAAAAWLILSPVAQAATYSDTGAAVLVWPRISVDATHDTVVTITNQSSSPVAAHCFYVNGNNRCTNTGQVCASSSECQDTSGFFGACVPGWIEINFDIMLTANQPLAWSAAAGLSGSALPCQGDRFNLPDKCPPSGSGNAGTRIPPVGETPFTGELKCIEADAITRLPAACQATPQSPCPNDLEGTATITGVLDGIIDPAKYNAVGLRTTGFNSGDNDLVIGGSTNPEYQPCPGVLVFNHFFDGAVDPISSIGEAHSVLSLVPCTENLLTQSVPQVTAQFLVYNEFEQRFSTSRSVNCLLTSPISQIDTSQPARSIFSAAVAGTVEGQTRITGVNGGLLGSATVSFCAPGVDGCAVAGSTAAYNLNQFADRDAADHIVIP
jgi:hypothetical protein